MIPADEQNGTKIQNLELEVSPNPHRCMLIDNGKNWRKKATRGPGSDDLENLGNVEITARNL